MEADFSLVISGDTTINGLFYKKLYTPFVVAGSNDNNCYLPDTSYQGAIRQDTVAKKVFIFFKGGISEKLYFDFTLSVNDTILGFLSLPFFTVQSIDSVLIGNSYRKKWVLDSMFDAYVIEGIGYNYGLVHNSYVFDSPGFFLTCFKQGNHILYPDTATSCELITVSIDEYNINKIVNIYPNPAKDEITIDAGQFLNSDSEIYDIYGKLIIHKKLINNNKINI